MEQLRNIFFWITIPGLFIGAAMAITAGISGAITTPHEPTWVYILACSGTAMLIFCSLLLIIEKECRERQCLNRSSEPIS